MLRVWLLSKKLESLAEAYSWRKHQRRRLAIVSIYDEGVVMCTDYQMKAIERAGRGPVMTTLRW